MLKRIILYISVAAVLIIAAPTKAQAAYSDGAAVGAALMAGFPAGASLGVTGQFKGVPVMFGLSGRIGLGTPSYFGLGLTADWWGFKHNFGPAGDSDAWLYLGPGGAFAVDFAKNYWSITAALRMPVGFSFIVKKNWEIYIEIAPSINVLHVGSYGIQILGLYVGKNNGGWEFDGFFGFSGQFGFRYWF